VGAAVANPGYRIIGRYALHDAIASGGMATVHLGKLLGAVGFSRTVAIKRLHAQYAADPEFVAMFLDEARLAARVQHPNVVQTVDVVTMGGELFLVMDYVHGESLARLIRAAREHDDRVPPRIVATIIAGLLHGLHAAHEARGERGEPLGIVHRDVSPHNVLVGADGIARVVDFGVAKATGRLQTTRAGQLKGKLAYMAPEQAGHDIVNRQTDVYAAAVVAWEAITGQRLFFGDHDGVILNKVMNGKIEPPSEIVLGQMHTTQAPSFREIVALDAIVMRGLARDPGQRFASAREMAMALEESVRLAPPPEVGEWVSVHAGQALQERARRMAEMDAHTPADRSGPYGATTMPLEQAAPPQPSEVPTRVEAPPRPVPPPQNFDVRTAMTPSQMSSISVSTPSGVAQAPQPRRWWLVGAGAAVGAFVMAAAIILTASVVRRHRRAAAAAAHPAPTVETPVVTTPQASAPSAASASASAPDPPPAVAPPTASVSQLPTAPAHTTHTSSPPKKPVSDECKPPYTLDEDGTRHYKPNCL
jgi:serine/threonine-protein kinase